MRVIARNEVRGSAADTDKQLKAQLSQWLEQPPRRIDRLILQCLLAAAPLKSQISGRCGLYLAAAHPDRNTMGALLNSVCVQHKQPKPFEFVNSVSNAAGFHIAQQLGLEGPNLFIGAGKNVWEQLQALAKLDLDDGVIEQALVVVCEDGEEFWVAAELVAEDSADINEAISYSQIGGITVYTG